MTTDLYHSNVKTLWGSSKKTEIYMSQVVKNQFLTWTGIQGVLYTDCQYWLYPQPSKPKTVNQLFFCMQEIFASVNIPSLFFPPFMNFKGPIPHNWEQ